MDAKSITDWVTAIGTAVTAAATVVLFVVALVQLRGLREQITQAADQERRRNTLEVIDRAESDPLIKAASANLWQASNHGTDYTKLTEANKFDAITLLNYLEGMAIGIFQNIYVEQMARDYLQEIVRKAVKALIRGESGDGWKATHEMFSCSEFAILCQLYDKWFPTTQPQFRAGKAIG